VQGEGSQDDTLEKADCLFCLVVNLDLVRVGTLGAEVCEGSAGLESEIDGILTTSKGVEFVQSLEMSQMVLLLYVYPKL